MDMTETAAVSAGSAILGAILSFFVQRSVWGVSARSVAAIVMEKRIANLEIDNELLKRDVIPLNLAVQQWAVEKLTHNHTPEMDELMTRIGPPCGLSTEEKKRLWTLLRERVVEFDDPEIDEVERAAAEVLLPVMKWIKAAAENSTPEPVLQTVSKEEAEEGPKPLAP